MTSFFFSSLRERPKPTSVFYYKIFKSSSVDALLIEIGSLISN